MFRTYGLMSPRLIVACVVRFARFPLSSSCFQIQTPIITSLPHRRILITIRLFRIKPYDLWAVGRGSWAVATTIASLPL